MFDVYSTLLSFPVTTLFGTHEERNQDVTSHAMTSGLFALEGLKILRYSLAMNLLGIAQAVDLRGGGSLLSPQTRPLYDFVRSLSPYVSEERPLHTDIEELTSKIQSGAVSSIVQNNIFNNFQ